MKNSIRLILIPCSLTLALSGCATIMSGSSQTVHVQVVDENTHNVIKDAKCTVTNARGVEYPIDKNPGTVQLPKVYGNLEVKCHAKDYYQHSIGVGSSFNAWTLGNIIFWPGLIVDAATGVNRH